MLRERQEVKGDPYFEKTMRAEGWGGGICFLFVFFNKDVFFYFDGIGGISSYTCSGAELLHAFEFSVI